MRSPFLPVAERIKLTLGGATKATPVRPLVLDEAIPQSLLALDLSPITASLSGNVSLNNTATFFDGPSIAQGTAGTWFVSGTVTVIDTAGAAQFYAKLWDGTTIIAQTELYIETANKRGTMALSGYLAAPAGNLRISVQDITSVSGLITAALNDGNGKASTITAIRVA